MNILWAKGEATVSEMIEAMGEPKPAYTTVLTVMQVLTRKEVVFPERRGKAHVFRPLLSREEYIDGFMHETRDTLFHGSLRNFLSFFVKSENAFFNFISGFQSDFYTFTLHFCHSVMDFLIFYIYKRLNHID